MGEPNQCKLNLLNKNKLEFLNGSSTHHLGLSTLDALRIFKTTELRKIVSDLNNEHFSKPSKFVVNCRKDIEKKRHQIYMQDIFLDLTLRKN